MTRATIRRKTRKANGCGITATELKSTCGRAVDCGVTMSSNPRAAKTSGAARIALVVCGLVVGLLLVEIGLRLTLPSLDFHFPTMRLTDDRFTERAGKTIEDQGVTYTFDSAGFRTTDGLPQAADGRAVLFIGDSFTQGVGVNADETFPAHTCDQLRRRGVAVRCLNA